MPINVTASDPFTAGYQLILAALRANTAFMDAAGRFTDWSDGTTQKPLSGLQPADLPEITLVQGAFIPKPHGRTSTTAEVTQTYTLVAVTDSLQVASANALKWAFTGAVYHANPESCTWGNSPFVADYVITNAADGTNGVTLPGLNGSPARGVDRVVSIIAVTLTMYAPRSSLPT